MSARLFIFSTHIQIKGGANLPVNPGLRVHVLFTQDAGVVEILQDVEDASPVPVISNTPPVVNLASRVLQNLGAKRLKKGLFQRTTNRR